MTSEEKRMYGYRIAADVLNSFTFLMDVLQPEERERYWRTERELVEEVLYGNK